jgi:hypothetical protein
MVQSRLAALGLVCLCALSAAFGSETTTYTYNTLGRLTKLQISGGPGNGAQVQYQYDNAGNRIQYVVSGSTAGGSITIAPFGSTANVTSTGVVLGVSISGSPAPTGMVTFSENGVYLGQVLASGGQASIIVEGLSLGTHTITASYAGDGSNAPSSHTFTLRVQNLSWLPAVLEILLSN